MKRLWRYLEEKEPTLENVAKVVRSFEERELEADARAHRGYVQGLRPGPRDRWRRRSGGRT